MQDKILKWCKDLSAHQGFYGRLYKYLVENPDELEELAKQNFKDCIEFIMFVES